MKSLIDLGESYIAICFVGGCQRGGGGGYDPVSRTNFNKIHASRIVLTKFHESEIQHK